jgi:RHS repeat-associated protein
LSTENGDRLHLRLTRLAGCHHVLSRCGSAICQARDASNATTREYLTEGEYVPGTTPASYYYGPDQIGSVRRVFASTSSAPAYSYDPYGVPLQTTTPLTGFNYAGMFFNVDSGLYLIQYRAYDPVAGRWLSRDPLGETSDPIRVAIPPYEAPAFFVIPAKAGIHLRGARSVSDGPRPSPG